MTALYKLFKTTTFRLSLIFLIFYGAVAAIAIGYIYWNTQVLLIRQLNQTVRAEIQGLAEQYRQGGMPLLAKTVAERSKIPGNSLYLVTDNQGNYIAGNLQTINQKLWNVIGDVRFSYTRPALGGHETRQAFAKSFRLHRDYRLLVGRDIEDRRIFDRVINSVIWGVGFMTLFGLIGAWFFSQRLLSRIETVSATSQSIMDGDLSQRIPLRGNNDELDRLSLNLNKMLDKIEHLMKELREVSDNIAHDLKTPLNRMKNRIDAALNDQCGEKVYKETLETIVDDTDNLINIFNSLLSIARMEAGASRRQMTELNLSELVEDLADLYEPVMEENNISFHKNIPGNIRVRGDKQLLGRAVSNLLDNAIKYGASTDNNANLNITLSISSNEEHVDLSVLDHGPGIPEEDKERVLKRFVRLEKSRSLPGSGLGLSLVSAVVQLHKGEFILEDNMPGLKATIRFPISNT